MTMAPSIQSAFLQCLSSLDVDIWEQVLLPKLVRQGSVQAVALTCCQLRDVCYSSVQHLKLGKVHASSPDSAVEEWMQNMPQHFSNCISVQLNLHEEASYHMTPYVLSALARLPKLQTLCVTVEGDLHVVPMSLLLYTLRNQLDQLLSLTLKLQQSWREAGPAWRELGKMTQLTELNLQFDEQVQDPLVQENLQSLSRLCSLQQLTVRTSDSYFRPLLSMELAAGWTALTKLLLCECHVKSIRHVGHCISLKSLAMYSPDGTERELEEIEWAAVGRLTGLVELDMFNAKLLSASPACKAAFSNLTKLQVVGAEALSVDVLPVFAACTQLTCLEGRWVYGGVGADWVVMPGMLGLHVLGGVPPFAVFPNLEWVQQSYSLFSGAFTAMAHHCTRLQELRIVYAPANDTSLDPFEPVAARVGAVKALSALTSLTKLDFMLHDGPELTALAHVVRELLPSGFRQLKLVALQDTAIEPSALMQLAKLHGLPALLLQLNASSSSKLQDDAANFLSALSGIRYVSIMGSQSFCAACQAAKTAVDDLGLPRPRSLEILQLD